MCQNSMQNGYLVQPVQILRIFCPKFGCLATITLACGRYIQHRKKSIWHLVQKLFFVHLPIFGTLITMTFRANEASIRLGALNWSIARPTPAAAIQSLPILSVSGESSTSFLKICSIVCVLNSNIYTAITHIALKYAFPSFGLALPDSGKNLVLV